MAKRDKGSYHKEPVRAQSEKRKILQSVGFVKTKTIYTQKKKNHYKNTEKCIHSNSEICLLWTSL